MAHFTCIGFRFKVLVILHVEGVRVRALEVGDKAGFRVSYLICGTFTGMLAP